MFYLSDLRLIYERVPSSSFLHLDIRVPCSVNEKNYLFFNMFGLVVLILFAFAFSRMDHLSNVFLLCQQGKESKSREYVQARRQ